MGVRLDVGGLMGALVGVAASSVGVCGLTPVSLPLFSAARRERKEKKKQLIIRNEEIDRTR